MSRPLGEPLPRIAVDGPLDGANVALVLRRFISTAGGAYLMGARWFGDKTRALADTEIADLAISAAGPDWHSLVVVDVRFEDGGASSYFTPLALTRQAPAGALPLAVVEAGDDSWLIVDALTLAGFRAGLLDQLEGDRQLSAEQGVFRWRQTDVLGDFLAAARTDTSRVVTAEQSNSAVIYGDALFLKAFRQLSPGINPELEIVRFLSTETSFRQLPLLVGELSYRREEGETTALAIVQTFIPSLGDGWAFILDHLATLLPQSLPSEPWTDPGWLSDSREIAQCLGLRTGQLHRAFAGAAGDDAFVPESVSEQDIDGWTTTLAHSIDATGQQLAISAPEHVDAFAAASPRLVNQAHGFAALRGTSKTRVHGDFHLGQTLRTLTDDFVFLDFEGEPARSLAERRAKTSPLKDVAGMLRSFSYARAAAFRAWREQTGGEAEPAVLASWEEAARAGFLDGYIAETADPGATFLPADRSLFSAALAAWELDKVIYELNYELNNRPDWVPIPLAAIVDRGA